MNSPSEEYVQRAETLGLLRLSPLHHRLMDNMYSALCPLFTLKDVIDLAKGDQVIVNSPSMNGVDGRIRLLAIRALQSLVESGIVIVVNTNGCEPEYEYAWRQEGL